MAGIYGDTLLAWPEQQQAITVYEMTPGINGGWTVTPDSQIKVLGVYQHTRGAQIKDSNGNLVNSQGTEFWTHTGNLDGKFVSKDNAVYRLHSSNDWNREGGFFRYGLEKLVGNNGTESDNSTWNTGLNSFS